MQKDGENNSCISCFIESTIIWSPTFSDPIQGSKGKFFHYCLNIFIAIAQIWKRKCSIYMYALKVVEVIWYY